MKTIAPLILASKSPRRKELFEKLGFPFTIQTLEVEEVYSDTLNYIEVPLYLSHIKSEPIAKQNSDSIVVGVDTIVYFNNQILGKPKDLQEAKEFLWKLNGQTHEVVSGVTLHYQNQVVQYHQITKVEFENLSPEIVDYYVINYQPLDKAGAYGIQDFWGLVGVKNIYGDFYNVMGLPMYALFQKLLELRWIVN